MTEPTRPPIDVILVGGRFDGEQLRLAELKQVYYVPEPPEINAHWLEPIGPPHPWAFLCFMSVYRPARAADGWYSIDERGRYRYTYDGTIAR